jgi:DNA-binding GntR family transcriptional regulator
MTSTPGPLNQITNKPLREQVVDALRDAIVYGELAQGQTLVEAELAAQLGVSRAPIREALQILQSERLVEIIPYHGTRVRRLTRRDIEELYSLRSVLEAFAIRRIVAHRNPDDVEVLRRHYREMLATADGGDLKKTNALDRAFHDTLIELSRHSMLISIWYSVSLRVRQVMTLLNERNADLKQIAYNHYPVIEAIAEWDEEKAVGLITQHIANTGELIAEGWIDEEDAESE